MLNPDIRDQAYQFFIEEAMELLQVIETGLLTLKAERSKNKVHEIMRAAHSIKGGAASVELDTIRFISHRLEDYFKALYHDEVIIDDELESLLLNGFDCLKYPLQEQIETGSHDGEKALHHAEPVFNAIEERLAPALSQSHEYIPSSEDLGIDIAASLFEIDVAGELQRLAEVLDNPNGQEIAGELRATAEVFGGFGEMLNLPGWSAICQTVLDTLIAHPEQARSIARLAYDDWQKAREAVLAGDRTNGGTPSPDWQTFQDGNGEVAPEAVSLDDVFGSLAEFATFTESPSPLIHPALENISLEDVFSEVGDLTPTRTPVSSPITPESPPVITEGEQLFSSPPESIDPLTAINDVFGSLDLTEASPEGLNSVFGHLSEFFTPDAEGTGSYPQALEEIFGQDIEISTDTTSSFEATVELPASFIPYTRDTVEEYLPPTVGSLEDVFGSFELLSPETETRKTTIPETNIDIPTIEEVFGTEEIPLETVDANLDVPTVEEIFGKEEEVEKPRDDFPARTAHGAPVSSDLGAIDEVFHASLESVLESVMAEFSSPPIAPAQDITEALSDLKKDFDKLPIVEELPDSNFTVRPKTQGTKGDKDQSVNVAPSVASPASASRASGNGIEDKARVNTPAPSNLSVRVDFNRLERMNNLVGELSINRNSLGLQNEQLQAAVKELLNRFQRFEAITDKLRQLSDKMLINPVLRSHEGNDESGGLAGGDIKFDALEMDRYSGLQEMVTGLLEEMMQLGESVDDIVLFARGSNQTLEFQRQMVTSLRDELMWARMLPLSEVLNRFPRVLRDLSSTYGKPAKLKLTGTGVLVDKAALEKLYDPLLHLLRNAFDHGIEAPEVRRQQGKPETGEIEIHAYHQGNQTIIEIKDDGGGLNFDKIRATALKNGLVSEEKLQTLPKERLAELIFEPGFSTADKVTQLSGRGVGLDVVRDQLRSLKGSVSVSSSPKGGTVFTLRLPLTLTIAKLLVCLLSTPGGQSTAVALPSDAIEEIVIPGQHQVKVSNTQRFLHFANEIVPIYPLQSLLEYRCPVQESFSTKALAEVVSSPDDWGLPLLILRQGKQLYALEVSRLVSEQELVIKPFGSALAPPAYSYGCTILGDGTLIPVINGIILLEAVMDSSTSVTLAPEAPAPIIPVVGIQAPLILVVDDSTALRRTLALSLEKAGYRVIQARDGREALEQLNQNPGISLVICDVEMPNMNGFEFLSQRRRSPALLEIPVAMLTSRGSDKHRQLAMQLGANDYFTKPYIEQQFLTSVKNLVAMENKNQLEQIVSN